MFGLGKQQEKDPVCGMAVDAKTAAGSLVHEGTTYRFCSSSCMQKFKANPGQFV